MSIEWFIIAVVLAWILDLLLGDPAWLPHPIVGFGKIIAHVEKLFNIGGHRLVKGALAVLFLVGCCYCIFAFMEVWITNSIEWLLPIFTVVFVFYGLANRTLIREGKAVFSVLKQKGLEAARIQLSRIVGRDTSQLNANEIRIAVLETMSENLSDGVVAPLFWFAVGGVPGMMTYKMINTLDSMWGYRNELFIFFGRIAARLDDAANLIPARLTGVLMGVVGGSRRSIRFMLKYGRCHKSPNSGYPEAAMAGILDCRFGGSAVYHGTTVVKPFIGANNRLIADKDIRVAARINHLVCFVMIILAIALRCYFMFGLSMK